MEDEDVVGKMRPGRVYVSKEFPLKPEGTPGRFIQCVLEDGRRDIVATILGEQVLRSTPSGKQQIKMLVATDERRILRLILQRFDVTAVPESPSKLMHFTLTGAEIDALLKLAAVAKAGAFPGSDKVRLDEEALAQFELTPEAIRSLLTHDQRLLAEIAERAITSRDVVALAYRRDQLAEFERLLRFKKYFENAAEREGGPERVWQSFFERNQWVFGFGLFIVPTAPLDDQKLEQVVAGYVVGGSGKRVDALLKSVGRISSLCFVELKTHATELTERTQYRPGVWAPSRELSQAVAQLQKTVERAEGQFQRALRMQDGEGAPTGEVAYLVRPRSVLVCGDLREFMTAQGVNEERFASFELFRRHLTGPEIVTFDELLERARLIVGS